MNLKTFSNKIIFNISQTHKKYINKCNNFNKQNIVILYFNQTFKNDILIIYLFISKAF